MIWNLLAIFLGGGLGATCRYGFSELIYRYTDNPFPYGILACNIVGSLLMGMAAMLITEKFNMAPIFRYTIMVGFLGGFTTFSSFSLDTIQLFQQGAWQRAVLYIVLSVVLCLIATIIGIFIANKI